MISHLETSEGSSVLPCLPLRSKGLGRRQLAGGQGPRHPRPAARLACDGGLTSWGSPKGEWKCPPCHPDGFVPNLAVPWLRLLGWGWQKRPGKEVTSE